MSDSPGPLSGLAVLELGQLLAGPFAGALLAWFGADVIKVEPPDGGDPLRTWRQLHHGTSLWWYSLARNKRSVTANLRDADGRDLVRRLAARSDVVIENFRPGRLEEWGLGFEDLKSGQPARDHGARVGLRPDRAVLRRSRAMPRWPKATADCGTSPGSPISRRYDPI